MEVIVVCRKYKMHAINWNCLQGGFAFPTLQLDLSKNSG